VELGVPARHGDIVEEDVAVGMPTARGDVMVQQEPGTRVRPAAHGQQSRTRRQRAGDPAGRGVRRILVDSFVERAKIQRGRDVEWGKLVVLARHRITSRVKGRATAETVEQDETEQGGWSYNMCGGPPAPRVASHTTPIARLPGQP
jgi:hypothetical protein